MGRLSITPRAAAAIGAVALLCACDRKDVEPSEGRGVVQAGEVSSRDIAQRVSGYLAAIQTADVAAAGEYWAEDARLTGPGMDLSRQAVLDGMTSTFRAGTRVRVVERKSLELFAHGNAAYEVAEAVEVFVTPSSTAGDTTRNNMFIRWVRGSDGKWRFSRVLISPKTVPPK
jgi:ketosteroid isomerase-like protein